MGQANSPFTQTPDDYVSDQVAFDAAYPSSEDNPRDDYLVFLISEGTPHAGLLVDARFGWTKNEIVQRFDYAAREGRFKPLPGSAVVSVGILDANSNTDRLKVLPPVQAAPIPAAPYRLSVGSTGSGTTWTVVIVANDGAFTSPPAGTAQLSLATGNLNWNALDLVTFAGQPVRFQQQQFYAYDKSTGRVGFAPVMLTDPAVLLNPKPGTGQVPLLRFGYSLYLTTVEVPNEGAFTVPSVGTVQWALNTGRLNFNPTDAANHAGIPVYYDGVVFAVGLQLPRQVLGVITAPVAIVGLPPAGDLIFELPAANPYYQFPRFSYVSSFSSGQVGVVQIDPSTGDVQFSAADQVTYAGQSVTVVFGDLPIEHGISLRLFRTPVNLDGSQDIKDVTAIYEVEDATWADPIIGSPQVFLPSVPIDDPAFPMVVKVEQGQGSFLSPNLPRLDVAVPPVGLGYYVDFDSRTLFFAQRKFQVLIPTTQPAAALALPDPLVLTANALLELETGPGTGIYVPLVIGTDALFDSISGVVSFTTTLGDLLVTGSGASFVGNALTDATANFVTAGVQPGHILEIDGPLAVKGIYTVATVAATVLTTDVPAPLNTPSGVSYRVRSDEEILADRFFSETVLLDPSTKVERILSLGTATNAPRLNVPIATIGRLRFRFGPSSGNQFSTSVNTVATDGAFTNPVLLPINVVEVSQATGNLNFSSANLGATAYRVLELIPKVDYILSAGLGLIQFTDRMLSLEEVIVTYRTAPPSTDPPTPPGSVIQEYGTFLIRKEVTQSHPTPTSTLEFNVAGLPVATSPAPAVFRGGRPQKLNIQCVVDTTTSTITFLADSQITDALPHGAIVNPNERVYIDYYVTQAVGGEQTITVLKPPLLTAMVNISETDQDGNPSNAFVVHGDQTSNFPAGCLLRIEQQEVYLIGSSVYDSGADATTITLAGNQVFQNSFTDPKVYVSSGPTPITSVPLVPAYYAPELQNFNAVARGMNRFTVAGDRTAAYKTGTVVLFTDGGSTFTDFLQVTGAAFDPGANATEVILAANAIRQYIKGPQILAYSVRPIFEPPTIEVHTSQIPVLTQPVLVYRRVSGYPGVILTSPADYTIDDAGKITFTTALVPNEEFVIFYTRYNVIPAGINLRATYTCQIAPNDANGLLSQILRADYFIYSPDSFYYRVETMTNFRGEYAQEIAAEASSGSSGPQTSNSSQPKLFEQGRTSLYFDEKHLANQDIVARSSLLFYNDIVNDLEDLLQALDGRVVGNNDGRFLFDGTTGAQHPPGPVTNQIDDVIQVSPAPYTITFPPFAVVSIGTFRKYYIPGPLSRFFPTFRNFFGVSASSLTSATGDEVLDTGSTSITLVANLHTRLAWAMVTESTAFSGQSILKVDNADGSSDYARPPFLAGMKCVVQRRDGTFINDETSPITVSAVSTTELAISGLAADADVGTTVYRSPNDDSAQVGADALTYYLLGRDYGFDGDSGQVTYVKPFPPLNGPPVPAELQVHPIEPQQAISGEVTFANTLTAPFKFPALYGGIADDDGDLSFPIQTPAPVSEKTGLLLTEDSIIHDPSGFLRILTTPPFVSTNGSLNPARTIITNVAGPFPAPVPQIYDLARILTGLNGPSSFVRIIAVGANTITLDTAFAVVDAGFTYEIGVSASPVAGTATFPNNTTLDDALATFITSDIVRIGHTIVVTSGPNNGARRQLTAILSETQLQFTPVVSSLVGGTYRVDDAMPTYGGTLNDYLTLLSDTLLNEIAVYPDEQTAILDFLNEVFTDQFVSATGQVTATLNVLDDASGTFLTSDISQAYFVFIETGLNAGIYQIQAVNSETQLLVDTPFPATQIGVSYRIVKVFGASKTSLQDLFAIYLSIGALVQSATTFQALVSTSVPVVRLGVPDATAFARGYLVSDLDARDAIVDARLATLNDPSSGPIAQVEKILTSTDMLYDKRYTWIDARINLENGLVAQQAMAVKNRVKAQADIYNQLIKLLAVEES